MDTVPLRAGSSVRSEGGGGLVEVLGKLVLLASKLPLLLSKPGLLSLACLPDTDGCQEGLEMEVEILWVDAEVPVEKEEQLLLHEVDLGDGETKALVAANSSVASPVLVLWRGVVEVLSSQDESGEEDPVGGAGHALGNWGKARP